MNEYQYIKDVRSFQLIQIMGVCLNRKRIPLSHPSAPEAVELGEDHLVFPGGVLLPLSACGAGVPGMPQTVPGRASRSVPTCPTPDCPSSSTPLPFDKCRASPCAANPRMRCEVPCARHALRALFEGVMLALAEKTGRRPSMTEQASDTDMDAAESHLSLGKPAFRMALMAGLFADRSRFEQSESARRIVEPGCAPAD